MKIAIDARSIMGTTPAGVGEYTFNIIKYLLKTDKVNQYFLFYNSFSEIDFPFNPADNVTICARKFPNKLLNFGFKILNTPNIEDLIKQDIDLFFVPNLNFFSLKKQTSLVLTIHDLSFELFPEYFSAKRRLWHKAINPKKLCERANKIIAVSESAKNDLIELYGIAPEKIEMIYSGVSDEYKEVTDLATLKRVKAKYKLPEKFILYLGTIEPRKNIEGLIGSYEAYRKRYKDEQMKLVIAGGKGWLYEQVFKRANQSEYNKDIIFTGYVDNEDKPALYTLASVFGYASFYEGFGFPVLESLCCKTPVVCGFSSSLGEIVGDKAILVDPYDFNQIAHALHESLKQKVTDKDINFLKEKFSWDECAGKTSRLVISIGYPL